MPDSAADPSSGASITYHRSSLYLGSPGGSLRRVGGCTGPGTRFPFAVGSRFTVLPAECAQDEDFGTDRLAVIDTSAPAFPRRVLSLAEGRFLREEGDDDVAVAGGFGAVDATVAGRSVTVVFDLQRAAEAYRFDHTRSTPVLSSNAEGFALGPDGSAVTVFGADSRCRGLLTVRAASDPGGRRLLAESRLGGRGGTAVLRFRISKRRYARLRGVTVRARVTLLVGDRAGTTRTVNRFFVRLRLPRRPSR